MGKKRVSYIDWKTAIVPEKVFSGTINLEEIKVDDEKIYWLEMRPYQKGRYVIVQKDKKEDLSAGKGVKDVIPSGFNVRTRVYEYGGGAFAVYGDSVYFVNFKDQRIYLKDQNSSEIRPITLSENPDSSLGKYASLTVSPDGKKLLFVYEKEYADKENKNFLGMLNLTLQEENEPVILAEGHDFYADAVFSPDGKRIAWLQWDHPDMPWDSTELMVADLKGNSLEDEKKVAGGKNRSVCLPKFDTRGKLYYVMDKKTSDTSSVDNWWNIYRYDDGVTESITSEKGEFGQPHWVFGQSTYDFLPGDRIIAKMIKNAKEDLVVIDSKKRSLSAIKSEFTGFSSLRTNKKGKVFFVGASDTRPRVVCSMDVDSAIKKAEILKKSFNIEMRKEDVSSPENISYRTKDGKKAYAFLYMPKNSRFKAPDDEKPPLLVIVHGGPTAMTDDSFSFLVQFWTSGGFAVVDVNYRGSTGFGRNYRDELISRWGVIDAQDVADVVRFLIEGEKVDPDKIAIRGGSAGGYMVQRVMTEYPELFRVGASYYGIGDLTTLVRQTHKFEARYIDNLVGTSLPEGIAEYQERSPINHQDRLKSPMIIFQGSDDRIVTPDCSRQVAQVLKEKGIKYEYIEYDGEQHGFRNKYSKVDSLKREYEFYRQVFLEK